MPSARSLVESRLHPLRPPERHRMMPLLETFAHVCPQPFFVQIGAHDGTQQDPLQALILERRWPGLLVEPVPSVFERLQGNYGHIPGIEFENAAVGAEDGMLPFYYLDEGESAGDPDVPVWFDALGSLDKSVLLAHRRMIPGMSERLSEMQVPVLRFGRLLELHDVESVDVLLIDTEGHDATIIGSIDFERTKPKLIIYEQIHLNPTERSATTSLLRRHGYEVHTYAMDVWCVNPELLTPVEYEAIMPLWELITSGGGSGQPLLVTRAVRKVGRTVLGRGGRGHPCPVFPLSESERRYFERGYDDRVPLPAGAEEALSEDSTRLFQLRRTYAGLDLPATSHHMWTSERVTEHVDLRYFRGDNLYVWHYPEHPRTMALKLFSFMRYLESRGGRPLLETVAEDGLFGAWTVDIPGYGKISRDLLDSVNELMILDRELGVLGHRDLRVLDIGAGYGRLAYRMATSHSSLADYCCVDAVPESTFLSEYHLQFRAVTPPARVLTLDRVETDLEPGQFDLALNIHSFSECTLAAIEWWLAQVARLEVPHLFVVPNEYEGIISREVDGTTRDALPAFTCAGYELRKVERVIADEAVRELVQINDNFMLFERAAQR
jgi:putative sugar O-methyltransferase